MYDFIVLENYLFISISKDLVFGSNDSLESFIEIRLNSDIKGVVLNLTNTTYIDSSGVSHILRIKKMIDLSLKSLFIVVDNPRIEKVLKISRIDKYINIYKNNQDVFDFNKTDDIEPGQKVYEYNMAIPGEFKYIQLVESFLKNILEKHYVFKDKDKYDINMYLEESLSNSIEHGYEESGLKGKISILVICRKTEIIIFIDDYGKGFKTDNLLDRVEESLTKDNIRGRGILILKGISDEIHIDSVENKISSIIIVKKLNMKE